MDKLHGKVSEVLMGGESGGGMAAPESPRYVYEDGRWVAEHWQPATNTWSREDTAAADVREQALTRAYDNVNYGANSAPPPMAAAPPPMAGAPASPTGGRFNGYGGAVQNRYVNVGMGGGFGQ